MHRTLAMQLQKTKFEDLYTACLWGQGQPLCHVPGCVNVCITQHDVMQTLWQARVAGRAAKWGVEAMS